MKMKKLIFLPVLILTLTLSCKKNNTVVPDTTTTTPEMARDSLYYIMKDWYFWFSMPEATALTNTTKANYKDPYVLMDAMRYKALDRWSFVADYDQFNAQMNGTFIGHGFRIGLDDSGNARIAMIYSQSALYLEGVRRGWIVKKINGTDVAPVLMSGDSAAYSNLIGPSEAGITNIFIFIRPDGSEETISATKSNFIVNTVILYDTLHLSTGVTGHLVFDSFISPSLAELETAFTFFKDNSVKDLILDLRYNSGGYLSIAQALASLIAGNAYEGSVFVKLNFNANHASENANNIYNIINTPYPLDLSRLVVITTRSTASASEAVMNGLKPYMNVVSIGDTTDGKPTGMMGWEVAKKYWFWPVTFKLVNKNDDGEYFAGIAPAKYAGDDITHDFNDRNELCLKEAIYYLETGSVSSKRSEAPFKRLPQFSEKSSTLNNTFVIRR
jgi:hypothetical protein